MKKSKIVEKFRTISVEDLAKEITEKGKYKVFSEFAELMDMRSYFGVTPQGEVKRKAGKSILWDYPGEEDATVLAKMILDCGEPEERREIHAISRMSNATMEKLQEKCMTTMVHGNFDYAKAYAKEIYLRDEDAFFQLMEHFVNLDPEGEGRKKALLPAFKACMKARVYDERLFHLYLSYLTRYRDRY